MRSLTVCLSAIILGVTLGARTAPDWSRFRGPNGSGISTATDVPIEFGPAEEPALAARAARGPLVADPPRRSDLPHGAFAADALVTIAIDRLKGTHPLGARGAAGQDEDRRQAEQPGIAEPGRRRQRRLRLLPRLRAHRLRRGGQRALVDAARAVQQHLRHGRLAGDRRRPGRPRVRSEPGLVHHGGEQAHRPRAVEGRSARSQERPLDADRLARARRQGSDPRAGIVPAHLLRRERRAGSCGGWADCRSR